MVTAQATSFNTDLSTRKIITAVSKLFFSKCAQVQGQLPENYIVFDVETTGVGFNTDLVTQVGTAIVKDRVCQEYNGHLLDWTSMPADIIDQEWLKDRIAFTTEKMAAAGKTMHTPYERLKQGNPPLEVLSNLLARIEQAREEGYALVGHNSWNFDRKMLEAHFKKYLQKPFDIEPNEMFDTGMLEKALQLDLPPYAGESMKSWAVRVSGQRIKGVFWSLDNHCVPKYNLAEKHGLDMANAHDAGYDCYITHLLLEEYRELAEKERSPWSV